MSLMRYTIGLLGGPRQVLRNNSRCQTRRRKASVLLIFRFKHIGRKQCRHFKIITKRHHHWLEWFGSCQVYLVHHLEWHLEHDNIRTLLGSAYHVIWKLNAFVWCLVLTFCGYMCEVKRRPRKSIQKFIVCQSLVSYIHLNKAKYTKMT